MPSDASAPSSPGIFNIYDLILNTLGKGELLNFYCSLHHSYASPGAALLFALALVFSGQAASITATIAGQVVSEGFILWDISVSRPSGKLYPVLIALLLFDSHSFAVLSRASSV